MNNIKVYEDKQAIITKDADGNIIESHETNNTRKVQRLDEPDYIKLYTNTWCEFNGIPVAYRALFLELATRMTYCNLNDLEHSQLVSTGYPYSVSIMNALGWKIDMYQKGLRALCDCGAIKRIARGCYQINPSYAGRGKWLYDPRLDQGGIKQLKAEFDFVNHKVVTEIGWADDGSHNPFDDEVRQHVGVGVVITTTDITPSDTPADEQKNEPVSEETDSEPHQMTLDECFSDECHPFEE